MTITPLLDRLDAVESSLVRAPRRFDVHEVPAFEAWAAEQRAAGHDRLVVDCSDVVFIDLAAIASLEEAGLGSSTTPVEIVWPSPAVRITLELLGHDLVAEAVAA